MKAVSIIGFVISCLFILAALYLQFILVPAADMFTTSSLMSGTEMDYALENAAREAKVGTAEMIIIGAGVGFLMSLAGFIKTKSKLALTGSILALVSVLIGLIHGTHMFS
jgi:hypothetical protein